MEDFFGLFVCKVIFGVGSTACTLNLCRFFSLGDHQVVVLVVIPSCVETYLQLSVCGYYIAQDGEAICRGYRAG